VDVAEVLGFDRVVAVENIRKVAPRAKLIEISATSGEGLADWYEFLRTRLPPL
jgi:hydrogenase nickel incorporation protein HypB